ncbi:MAG: hypothetical protein HZC38_01575 [Chloroflexi bacterium]|nr:hypothetical protein [Chloroflexota bacterium]
MKTKHLQIALSFVVLVSLACTCSALPDLTAIANDLATPTASASSGGGSTSTKVAPAMGLKERTANSVVSDSTFSFVFDGYKNGKAIVIQGVALGANSTNVNIRFESI